MGAVGIVAVLAGLALASFALGSDAGGGGERVFDVVAHGARGDGTTDDTKAFEAAWAAACGARGRSSLMLVPARRSFLVGPVSFHGPCASATVTVQIAGSITAPPASAWSGRDWDHWLLFDRVDGLRVTGNGVLDGSGSSWWVKRCRRGSVSPLSLHRRKACVKAAPTALKLVNCNNLELSHFSSKNSPQMHIAILASSNVTVDGLDIAAPGRSPNTDGIHLGRCQDVRITGCRIGTGDDCISISSGSRFVTVGLRAWPRSEVANATERKGPCGRNGDRAAVEYIDVKNVHFIDTTNGVRIKTWQGGHGYAKSVSFSNIEFTNVARPVLIDQFYHDHDVNGAVEVRNITYNNLRGTSSQRTAVSFDCSGGGSCTGIHVNTMKITGSGGRETVARCRNAQVDTSGDVYPEIPCLS